jgi:hypothetical protein
VDPSALIFVALAVAWAVYLIPKAVKHHDEAVRSRSVEKFSHTMRVLARREPVDRRNARLVVSPIRAARRPPVETKAHAQPGLSGVDPVAETVSASVTTTVTREVTAPVARASRPSPATERASARRAARRRRNVLALVLLANTVVIGLAAAAVIGWPWVAAPAAVLVAWLVACRVSVRAERRQRAARAAIEIGLPPLVEEEPGDLTGELPVTPPQPRVPAAPATPDPAESSPAADAPAVVTGEIPVVGGWDMVPTTLPTYVSKPAAARRTVSTIDLDSTGVWSSGRNDEDSALARSAEQSARTAREADETERDARRASGA